MDVVIFRGVEHFRERHGRHHDEGRAVRKDRHPAFDEGRGYRVGAFGPAQGRKERVGVVRNESLQVPAFEDSVDFDPFEPGAHLGDERGVDDAVDVGDVDLGLRDGADVHLLKAQPRVPDAPPDEGPVDRDDLRKAFPRHPDAAFAARFLNGPVDEALCGAQKARRFAVDKEQRVAGGQSRADGGKALFPDYPGDGQSAPLERLQVRAGAKTAGRAAGAAAVLGERAGKARFDAQARQQFRRRELAVDNAVELYEGGTAGGIVA